MSSTKRRNARRKGLFIGINKYQNPANWLNGCVADALDMVETVKILKLPPRNMHMLLDEQASTQGILDGLDWLTKDAQPGDILIFYYSGHGSQVVDLNNDEKEDGYDEIICPWDIDFENGKYITDDTLYKYFTEKVPEGVRTDVILDSCFSGSATRSIVAVSDNNKNISKMKQRYLPPPPEHIFRINSMVPQFTNVKKFGKSVTVTTGNKKEIEKVSQHNCLLTGSQENDVSYEDVDESGNIRGVMTARFTRILRRSNGDITRREAYSILRSTISNDGFPQVPNLEVPNEEALNLFFFRKESEVDRPSELNKK